MLWYENDFHCLAIQDKSFDTGKTYQQNFQGYLINQKNEKYLVFHKKEIKIVDFKDIGETMGILLLIEREKDQKKEEKIWLSQESFACAWRLFPWFDEFSGETYFYLPHFPLKEIETTNHLFQSLEIAFHVEKTEKGVFFLSNENSENSWKKIEELQEPSDFFSFLFGLTLLYGKFEVKNEEFRSFKIHLPLFGPYLQYKETLDTIIKTLQKKYYFLQTSENQQNGVLSYQISCNDGEILAIFDQRMQQNRTITKQNLYQEVEKLLMDSFEHLAIENQKEITMLLKEKSLKVLVK